MMILQEQRKSIDISVTIFTVALAFIFCTCASIAADTLRVYRMPEVEIKADRISTTPITKYSSSYFIDKDKIRRTGLHETYEILSQSPGIFIKNYGGAGGLKSVSIRGTGATQNLIMLDGVPLNSAQNAMFDISLFPSSFISSVEVVRGGASDVYGANAVGGVVNIITGVEPDSNRFKMSVSGGSYSDYKAEASYEFNINGVSSVLNGEYADSKGNYDFHSNQNGREITLSRENASFQNFAMNYALRARLTENVNFDVKSIASHTKRGVPGAVLQNRIESLYSKLFEDNFMNIISVTDKAGDYSTLKFTGAMKYSRQNYKDDDPLAFSELANSLFKNYEYRAIANYKFRNDDFGFQTNTEYDFTELRGDMLDKSVGRYVKRGNFSVSAIADKTLFAGRNSAVSVSPSLRWDVFTDNSPNISWGAGATFGNSISRYEIKARISGNFRMPSFNELYYYNYGTSNLKPEKSTSYSLSLSKIFFDNYKFEISGFYNHIKNQIISVPKNTISWSAQNLGLVKTYGIEFYSSGVFLLKNLNYTYAYTYQSVKDRSHASLTYGKYVVYSPREMLSASLVYSFAGFTFSVSGEHASHRYSMADNSYASMLPQYSIFSLGCGYDFYSHKKKFGVRADCLNIFDEEYEVIKNYPMPGRTFRFTFNTEL